MPFDGSSIPSGKELLCEYNEEQFRKFKLTSDEEIFIQLYSPSWIPYKIARSEPDDYRKTRQPCGSSSIDFIYKNGEYHSFIWHTTADKIKTAVRYGIVTTYSVTGKVISALGQYRLIELDRMSEGTISNRYVLKNALLNSFQDRFELLEPLELLANRQVSSAEIEAALQTYQDHLTHLLDNPLIDLDRDSNVQILVSLRKDIRCVQAFRKKLKADNATRATGVDSILTFVKTQMIRNLREMQNINQNITYRSEIYFAATRGDLNSCIEDAEAVIENHAAPARDVMLAEHHGHYGDQNTSVAYDSSQHVTSHDKEMRALLAISFIEQADDLDVTHPAEPKVNQQALKIVAATKWGTSGSPLTLLKKSLAWVANIGIKLIFASPDLFTLGTVPLFRRLATQELKVKNPLSPRLSATELQAMIPQVKNSLGSRVRYFLRNAIKNSIEDMFYGINDIYKSVTINLFNDVYNDYADGKERVPLADTLDVVQSEIDAIAKIKLKERREILLAVNRDNELDDLNVRAPLLGEKFASPDYIPSAGDWHDLLSGLAYGGEQFLGLFLHNVHAKHPFTGLLFNLAYVTGGLAVLAPKYVAFLGSRYITFAQGLGYSMATDPVTAAISSGITQAEMFSAAFELLIHGTHSWTAMSATQFEHDPAVSLVYTATAVGLGYAIAFKLHVPWLSEFLREDLGTFPPSALGFAGAKLGLLVVELLEEHDYESGCASEKAGKVKLFLMTEYKNSHPDATEEEVATCVDHSLEILFSKDNMLQLRMAKSLLQQDGHAEPLFQPRELERAHIQYFLLKNRHHLPHLSAKSKHALAHQFPDYFSYADTQSLKKFIYLETATSILRSTLSVILGYVVYPPRLIIAAGSSLWHGNERPLISAGSDFALKVTKDVTRVARALSKGIKTILTLPRRQLKTVFDVIANSFLARGQSLFSNSHYIADANYAISAKLDVAYEKSRQLFSKPVDAAVKAVTFANPESEKMATSTYLKIWRATSFQPGHPDTRPGLTQPSEFEEHSLSSSDVKIVESDAYHVKNQP